MFRILFFLGGEPEENVTTHPAPKKASKESEHVATKASSTEVSKGDTPKRRSKKIVE